MAAPQDTWTILEILKWTTDYFRDKGVSEPRASAELLLAHTLKVSRLDLYLRFDQPLNREELARFKALMVRRRQGEPTAYLTGRREFWSLDFKITPAVLIPRPETETLVAAALEAVRGDKELGRGGQGPRAPAPSPKPPPPTPYVENAGAGLKPAPAMEIKAAPQNRYEETIALAAESLPKTIYQKPETPPLRGLEVGVGSGAVIVALARELPQSQWLGVDLSAAALAVARDNARRHGVNDRVQFLQADLLRALKAEGHFALLAANLPYVPRPVWEGLPQDIKEFEPREALLGGDDGLDLIRALLRQAHRLVQGGGWVLLEVGDGQAPEVAALMEETGAYERVEKVKDFSGVERVVRARRRQAAD